MSGREECGDGIDKIGGKTKPEKSRGDKGAGKRIKSFLKVYGDESNGIKGGKGVG